MTEQDKKDFIEILKESENRPKKEIDVMDLGFKAMSTFSVAMIVWIFTTTNELKNQVGIINTDSKYTTETLNELKTFAKQPRFTKENFLEGVTPIINNTNKNTIELQSRSSFLQEVESRLIKLELENQTFKKNK